MLHTFKPAEWRASSSEVPKASSKLWVAFPAVLGSFFRARILALATRRRPFALGGEAFFRRTCFFLAGAVPVFSGILALGTLILAISSIRRAS